MTAVHWGAERLRVDGGVALYRFTPDSIREDIDFGQFRVDAATWEFSVVREPRCPQGDFSYPARCVPGLIHRLKKLFESQGAFPARVSFIA